jgi:hypothetical protein
MKRKHLKLLLVLLALGILVGSLTTSLFTEVPEKILLYVQVVLLWMYVVVDALW